MEFDIHKREIVNDIGIKFPQYDDIELVRMYVPKYFVSSCSEEDFLPSLITRNDKYKILMDHKKPISRIDQNSGEVKDLPRFTIYKAVPTTGEEQNDEDENIILSDNKVYRKFVTSNSWRCIIVNVFQDIAKDMLKNYEQLPIALDKDKLREAAFNIKIACLEDKVRILFALFNNPYSNELPILALKNVIKEIVLFDKKECDETVLPLVNSFSVGFNKAFQEAEAMLKAPFKDDFKTLQGQSIERISLFGDKFKEKIEKKYSDVVDYNVEYSPLELWIMRHHCEPNNKIRLEESLPEEYYVLQYYLLSCVLAFSDFHNRTEQIECDKIYLSMQICRYMKFIEGIDSKYAGQQYFWNQKYYFGIQAMYSFVKIVESNASCLLEAVKLIDEYVTDKYIPDFSRAPQKRASNDDNNVFLLMFKLKALQQGFAYVACPKIEAIADFSNLEANDEQYWAKVKQLHDLLTNESFDFQSLHRECKRNRSVCKVLEKIVNKDNDTIFKQKPDCDFFKPIKIERKLSFEYLAYVLGLGQNTCIGDIQKCENSKRLRRLFNVEKYLPRAKQDLIEALNLRWKYFDHFINYSGLNYTFSGHVLTHPFGEAGGFLLHKSEPIFSVISSTYEDFAMKQKNGFDDIFEVLQKYKVREFDYSYFRMYSDAVKNHTLEDNYWLRIPIQHVFDVLCECPEYHDEILAHYYRMYDLRRWTNEPLRNTNTSNPGRHLFSKFVDEPFDEEGNLNPI